MSSTHFFSATDVETVKCVANNVRSELSAKRYNLPGKRRFQDIFAQGLGFSSFSEITVHAKGIEPKISKVGEIVSACEDALVEAISIAIDDSSKQAKRDIRSTLGHNVPAECKLIHHLYVQRSREIYFSDRYGFFPALEQLCPDLSGQKEIRSVVFVVLKVEGFHAYIAKAHFEGDHIDLAEFLVSAWNNESELFESPDQLVVSKALAELLPELGTYCTQHGVMLVQADGKNRVHTAIGRKVEPADFTTFDTSIVKSLDQLNIRISEGMIYSAHTKDERNLLSSLKYRSLKRGNNGVNTNLLLPITLNHPCMKKKNPLPSNQDEVFFIPTSDGYRALSIDRCNKNHGGYGKNIPFEEALERITPDFVSALKNSSIHSLSDYERQKELCKRSRQKSLAFDALYFGAIQPWREGFIPGLFHNNVVIPQNARDACQIVAWSSVQDSKSVIFKLGDSNYLEGHTYVGFKCKSILTPKLILIIKNAFYEKFQDAVSEVARWVDLEDVDNKCSRAIDDYLKSELGKEFMTQTADDLFIRPSFLNVFIKVSHYTSN